MKPKLNFSAAKLGALLLAGLAIVAVYVTTPIGSASAQKLVNQLGISNKYMCVFLPKNPSKFDTLDSEKFKTWNKSFRYSVNPHNLSVVNTPEGSSLRQRFIPSEKGSERVVASIAVEARTTYELKQSIFFEKGFDWGGEAQSGKFGFGLGGGSAPTGGATKKDGFTARLVWLGKEDGTVNAALYLYSADRSLNLPYGDVIEIPNFTIPVGEWFEVTVRLTVNSEHGLADGNITVQVNNETLLERENIQWQTAGEKPIIDRLMFSSFHGGNSTAWSPAEIVYAQFAKICLYD